jgi:4-amino-4-deoxy-L-arabinose transferase-like glycosyltransferase
VSRGRRIAASAAGALPLAAIVLFVVAARLNLLSMPLERDDGTYAYLGQLVLDGQTPYVSFYETKPPLLYYAYAAVIGIFGQTLEGLHAGFLLVNLGTTLLLFRIARILFNRRCASVVAACFAVLSLTPTASGYTAQSEHLVALGATAGLWLTLEALARRRRALLVLAGASLAAAFLVKQTALFFLLWVLALPALDAAFDRERGWRIALRELGPGALGAVAVMGLTLLAVALQGALQDMGYWTLQVPRYYGSQLELGFGIQQLFFHLERVAGRYLVIWGLAAVGFCTLRICGLGRFEQWLIAGFAAASAASIVPGLRFYGHYWLQLMPAVALLCGAAAHGLEQLLARRVRLRPVHAAAVSAVLVAAVAAEALARDLDYYRGRHRARIVREVYGTNPFLEAQVAGDFVRSTRTDDPPPDTPTSSTRSRLIRMQASSSGSSWRTSSATPRGRSSSSGTRPPTRGTSMWTRICARWIGTWTSRGPATGRSRWSTAATPCARRWSPARRWRACSAPEPRAC